MCCCFAEKNVNSRQKMKASNFFFRCNISKLCFILPSFQYKLLRRFVLEEELQWTGQSKESKWFLHFVQMFVCLFTFTVVFCFLFYFLWCVYKSSRCNEWSVNEFLTVGWRLLSKKKLLFVLPCINQFCFFFFRKKCGEKLLETWTDTSGSSSKRWFF